MITTPTGVFGSNQLGVKDYNERLILQTIRQAGPLPKADIARMTRLSAQAVSVIISRFLAQGLVTKGERLRRKGQVGQPSVPIALAPDGAYSLGIKIGRQSVDLVLMNFAGTVLSELSRSYEYPTVAGVSAAVADLSQLLVAQIPEDQRSRLVGAGVAAPFSLDAWAEELGAPAWALVPWRETDIAALVGGLTGLPVTVMNDATAACLAELIFGRGSELSSFLYIFVGTFVGGGVVLDRRLYPGRTGNAGAIGSFVLSEGGHEQLISKASLIGLRNQPFERWLAAAVSALTHLIENASAVIDFEAVVIDSSLPDARRAALIQGVRSRTIERRIRGVSLPEILAGNLGYDARVLGGALLPLYATFAPHPGVLTVSAPL